MFGGLLVRTLTNRSMRELVGKGCRLGGQGLEHSEFLARLPWMQFLGLSLVYASTISHFYIDHNTNDRTSTGNGTNFTHSLTPSSAVTSLTLGCNVCAAQL